MISRIRKSGYLVGLTVEHYARLEADLSRAPFLQKLKNSGVIAIPVWFRLHRVTGRSRASQRPVVASTGR
jgi:hypothetical protein